MSSPGEFDGTIKFDPALLREPAPAAADHAHYLVQIAGERAGFRVEVTAEPVTLGRSAGQTLVFAGDTALSRRHAQISLLNNVVVVEDLGSTNGTFVDGARVQKSRPLTPGAVIKAGEQAFRYEYRSRDEVRRSEELDRDLARANGYVTALLPEPLTSGAVLTDWRFVPSARLGGDGFGYCWLDERSFAIFLLDVSGHGVGAAMHSVTVLNVLRQRVLPDVDWHDPGSVLATLNERFQMDDHDGMFLTAWYGVYDTGTRVLRFSAAGHHAAYVVAPDRSAARPLGVKALMIGAVPGLPYPVERADIPAGSVLYLFSDGVFELTTKTGAHWAIADFLPLLTAPVAANLPESERLYREVQEAAVAGPLEDDFSLVAATFL